MCLATKHVYTIKGEIMAKKAKSKREKIILECTECKNRNYNTTKNKANDPDRLELKKFCPTCRKETSHKETK